MTSNAETTGAPAPTDLVPPPRRAGPAAGGRARWAFWRSPADQPVWARPALLAVAAFAGLLYAWNITSSGIPLYYGNATKSMSVSWKALLFGAMDPGATVTPDKIAGSFVPQALFVRVFGFHDWALTMPQCVEGVVCVLVMYRMVRRWAGPAAGIIAAGLFTFTPVCVSMFGHGMEDGALTMCLVLAADRFQVAVEHGRLRSLVWAGVWVGIGFQAKMLQAWMVLPAFAAAYLLAAPEPVRRRVGRLLVAGVACLAVSVSWVGLMTVVPAKDRPYADGSSNNSAVAMVFGYNGLSRFGIKLPGALEAMGGGSRGKTSATGGAARPGGESGIPAAGAPAAGSPAAGTPAMGTSAAGKGSGTPGGYGGPSDVPAAPSFGEMKESHWTKLFTARLGPQIIWTLPFALIALALGLYVRRRAARTDTLRTGFVTWGTWLAVIGLIFSDMSSIPHTAYMASLAPPLAALGGAGAVLMWRAYREGGRTAWVLPAAVAVQAGWSCWLWRYHSAFLPWLRWLTLACAVAGVVALALGRLGVRARSRVAAGGLLLGMAAAVAAPVAWSSSAFDTAYDGSSFDATAGPYSNPFGSMMTAGISGTLSSDHRKLWDYVVRHQEGAEYPLATENWTAAQPYILATGEKVLPMGGFSGTVPQPTPHEFTQLVHKGKLRFVLTGFAGPGALNQSADTPVRRIDTWVTTHCDKVPAKEYGGKDVPSGASQQAGPAAPIGETPSGPLYRCSPGS